MKTSCERDLVFSEISISIYLLCCVNDFTHWSLSSGPSKGIRMDGWSRLTEFCSPPIHQGRIARKRKGLRNAAKAGRKQRGNSEESGRRSPNRVNVVEIPACAGMTKTWLCKWGWTSRRAPVSPSLYLLARGPQPRR